MRTLLLAESHAPTRIHLEDRLKAAGYQVHAVAEVGEAVECFVTQRPDAVVLSADFPLLQGKALPAHLAAAGLRPLTPLVVIDKAHLGKARGRQAILGLKPDAYVEDPLKGALLREKLDALTEKEPPGATGVGVLLSRPPVESGLVSGADAARRFCSFFHLRRSGLWVLAEGAQVSHVYLVDGAPVAFASTLPPLRWSARNGGDPGPASGLLDLPARESVAEGGPLATAWSDHVRRRTAEVVGATTGRFAFYSGDELREELPLAQVPALAPVLDSARASYSLQRLHRVLSPHLDRYPVRTASFAEDVRALGLDTPDLKVAMQITGRLTLSELMVHGWGDLPQSYSLFWFLSLCGALTFVEQALPATGTTDPLGLPRRRKKTLDATLATQLREEGLRIITGSYFKALALEISADSEAVEAAYRDMAMRFHPDTYAEYDLTQLVDLLESVQEKLTAAYRVLSVEEKRVAYLQYLFSRAAPGRVTPVHVSAEIALRRGEDHAKRGDLRSAVHAFEEAVQLNPREPEYYSYLAWFTYRLPEGATADRARSADRILRKALSLNPAAERAQVLRAILESDVGEMTSARQRLLKVLKQNPEAKLAKAALRRVNSLPS